MKRLERLGRYRIVSELGRGAMGTVFEAHDERLDRQVALKTISLNATDSVDTQFRARFEREARSAARLNHRGIVTIYESGEEGGIAYIAMELLRGRSLREMLDAGHRFSLYDVERIGIEAAEALDFAHEHGVIHRDIKPSNLVMLEDGSIKITDFGVAHFVNEDLTQVGTVIGTPKYMAPEQINSSRIDGRADLFSLGTVLYELAAREPAFSSASIASVMYHVVNCKPVSITKKNNEVPDTLAWVIGRCLAKHASNRYASGRLLAHDLRSHRGLNVPPAALASMYSSDAKAVDEPRRPPNESKPARPASLQALTSRGRRIAGMGAGLAGLMVLGTIVAATSSLDSRRADPSTAARPTAATSAVVPTTATTSAPGAAPKPQADASPTSNASASTAPASTAPTATAPADQASTPTPAEIKGFAASANAPVSQPNESARAAGPASALDKSASTRPDANSQSRADASSPSTVVDAMRRDAAQPQTGSRAKTSAAKYDKKLERSADATPTTPSAAAAKDALAKDASTNHASTKARSSNDRPAQTAQPAPAPQPQKNLGERMLKSAGDSWQEFVDKNRKCLNGGPCDSPQTDPAYSGGN